MRECLSAYIYTLAEELVFIHEAARFSLSLSLSLFLLLSRGLLKRRESEIRAAPGPFQTGGARGRENGYHLKLVIIYFLAHAQGVSRARAADCMGDVTCAPSFLRACAIY